MQCGERLVEFESKSVKTRDAVKGFHLLKYSHKLSQGFHKAMKEREYVLFLLYKIIIFCFNKDKDDIIQSTNMYIISSIKL